MKKFKKYYVAQVDENDCGVAALAMIMRRYGSTISLSKLRNYAQTTLEGTTALGIIEAAQKFGFDAEGYQAEMDVFDDQDIDFPAIVHVNKEQKYQHYYVVIDSNKEYIKIADPDIRVGIKKVKREEFAKEWTGIILYIVPGIDYQPVKEKESGLFNLSKKLVNHKLLITNVIIASFLMTLISILGSYFIQVIIDDFIPSGTISTLSITAIGLLITYVFNSVFSYARNFLLAVLGQRLSIDIILSYIKHIFELPIGFFVTRKTGDIISRFNDGNKIIDALASIVVSIFLDVGTVLFLGIILAIQNFRLFTITLLSLPIYIVIIFSFSKLFERLNRQEMESNAILSSSVIEDIQGIETIKALNSEQVRYRKIDSQFVDLLKKSLAYTKVDALQQAFKIFIQSSLTVITLWIGAKLVIKGFFSVGQLMTYNTLLAYFIGPLQNIINLQPKFQSAQVANARLNEIYNVESEFKEVRGINDYTRLAGEIEFQNVNYSYGYGRKVLDGINLLIKPGEKVTIIGMSGSGKSTLVKMLVNFFEPDRGRVVINNNELSNIDKHILRSYVIYLPQTPYIFSGTILDNLLLGSRPNITEEDIHEACRLAMIEDDIAAMPLGFDTKLDENGGILSGGQKQRITIARTLLSPAKVMIFDESTSGLDAITESQLVENLLSLTDKTIIFVAHRLSIAQKTNNIIVMNQGKIVEKGSHQQLMDKKGYYERLVKS